MQRAELRSLPVLWPRRDAEVPILPRQLDDLAKIELGVFGQTGEQKSAAVLLAADLVFRANTTKGRYP